MRAKPHLLILLIVGTSLGVAQAGDDGAPTIDVTDTWVHGEVVVRADRARVLSRISDPRNVIAWEGGGTTLTMQPDGSCQRLSLDVPSAVGRIRYVERRCATSDGFASSLVESEDFEVFEAQWTLTAEGERTRVRYSLHSRPSFPVPQALARRLTGRSIRRMLAAMREDVEGP